MKIGNLNAEDYRVEGEALTVVFTGDAQAAVEALDGSPSLAVTTGEGEVVELLRGFTLLSRLTLDRDRGRVTAVFRHVSETETALAEARRELAYLQAENRDILDALVELGDLVAAGAAPAAAGTEGGNI